MKSLIKPRPKQLLAVYVEPQQVEVLRARRKWRSWQIESVEQFPVPAGEAIYDFLQRLNLRPRGRRGAALVLLLPRLYYGFHREHYPAALAGSLDEALAFDWPENVFHEPEQTLHFFGKAIPIDSHLSVPIFSLSRDVYEKFHQALGGSGYQTFNVVPAAPSYRAFATADAVGQGPYRMEVFGRVVDSSHLEVNRFYNGLLLDSVIIGSDRDQLRLFRETLRSLEDPATAVSVPLHLICRSDECDSGPVRQWQQEDLPLQVAEVEAPLISYWLKQLLAQESVSTFNPPLLLKPRQIPKAAYVIGAMIGCYSLYAFYQARSYDQLWETSQLLKKQRAQLEAQWKPLEQLQTRIVKFQEGQKALAQFGELGYPMIGILTLLTEVTPQDTWLNYLSLRERELTLRGESNSAIKYLTELSKVKGFEDVRFASPVTRNPSGDNKERFNVQLKINPQVLQEILDTIPIEGGVAPLPPEDAEKAASANGTKPPPQKPTMTAPEAQPAVYADDNATMSVGLPSAADDNATLNRKVK